MKNLIFITIVPLLFITTFSNGQWTSAPPILTTTDFVGIGAAAPASALHVDGNNMTGPATISEVFRTDAPAGAATYWRLLRGGTNYGTIFNNNDNHFYIQATNGSGDLRFQTGGANTRMTILSGGNVGIGTATPATGVNLHVNSPTTADAIFRLSVNGSTTATLDIGTDVNGTSYLNARPTGGHL